MSDPCYVELAVSPQEEARFALLLAVTEELRRDKDAEAIDAESPKWRNFFDERALAHFWWPTDEERAEWTRRWFATPVETRFTDPALEHPWDFESLVDAFANGEYQLLGLRRVDPTRARFELDPYAFPYGGLGCVIALIEAFDLRVLEIYDGGGPPYAP
jgi:hypothetical protein